MSAQMVEEKHQTHGTAFTKGPILAKNIIWNLLGQGVPLFGGLIAIPPLVHGLGTDRFGVLSIAWMVIGYFSIFDLGLGRALTKLISEKIGAGEVEDMARLIWTALVLIGFLGLFGMLVLAGISNWLVYEILNIPTALQAETLKAFYLLALSVPLVITATGLRGIMEAHQKFKQINAVRIPFGLFTFLGPLVVMLFSVRLNHIVMVLIIGRLVVLGIYIQLCLRLLPSLRTDKGINKNMVFPLISFGGWMTVSNIVGPLMVYLDRFLIGAVISMTAVAYYATPYEVVTKLWIIPTALVSVLFPAFSMTLAHDKSRAVHLLDRGICYIFFVMFPLALIILTLSYEGLYLWLGEKFATNSETVLQLLAIGVFINSLARVPFVLIQGAGRPDIIAKMHLLELPFYLYALWWILADYGIEGAAIVWVLRIAIDTAALFFITYWLLPETAAIIRKGGINIILSCVVLLIASQITSLYLKIVFICLILVLFFLLVWQLLLSGEEREKVKRVLSFYSTR